MARCASGDVQSTYFLSCIFHFFSIYILFELLIDIMFFEFGTYFVATISEICLVKNNLVDSSVSFMKKYFMEWLVNMGNILIRKSLFLSF